MSPGINRLSDLEFNRSRTVELLYTTGMVSPVVAEDKHFHFLRRVICDNIVAPPPLPTTTLRSFLKGTFSEVATDSENAPLQEIPDQLTQQMAQKTAGESDNAAMAIESQNAPTEQTPQNGPTEQPPTEQTPEQPESENESPEVAIEHVITSEAADQTPEQPKKRYTKRARKELANKKRRYTILFNSLLEDGTLSHKTATQMLYNPSTERYFVRNMDQSGKFQPKTICENVGEYDQRLVQAAQALPEIWVGPTPGDSSSDIPPTRRLTTKVASIHQQHDNPYCLVYSLASALFYCGFDWQAAALTTKAEKISTMSFDDGLKEIREFMKEIVSLIGIPTIFGKRTNSRGRRRQVIEWDYVLNNVTPYPTLVIPVLPDGSTSHAFCVVDDLIFDSSTQYALKLQWESVSWIFHGSPCRIYQMYQFETKWTPQDAIKECKKDQYTRPVTYHWDHPSRPSQK